jgi:hypothetical protein
MKSLFSLLSITPFLSTSQPNLEGLPAHLQILVNDAYNIMGILKIPTRENLSRDGNLGISKDERLTGVTAMFGSDRVDLPYYPHPLLQFLHVYIQLFSNFVVDVMDTTDFNNVKGLSIVVHESTHFL